MVEKQVHLKLWNSETRRKEAVIPVVGHKILLYTCGPTVYHYAHIGNFRTYVFEDLLRRTLKFFGMEVKQVMNITDVEDKILAGALHQNQSLQAYTQPYIEAFFKDLDALGIEPAEHYPKATDYIPKMVEMIAALIEKGVAYKGTDESIYFSIHHFPSYGRLSHFHLEELKSGASQRVNADEYEKENIADFVLWKAYDPKRDGQIYWESPFGKGRPGWHIECSAMGLSLLGETIDIHVGGVDNLFPHHENEIAQSEAYTGKQFVRHWLHSEHLLVDGKKMSKSLGNFYTLRTLLERGYSGRQVRFLLLQTHYRTQLNFTFQGLEAAASALERLSDFVERLKNIEEESSFDIEPFIQETFEAIRLQLGDDLNISPALAALFDFVRKVNQLCDEKVLGKAASKRILIFLKEIDALLGIIPLESEELPIPLELEEALARREQARIDKAWALADKERDFIASHGFVIEDTPQGPRLKPKK